ncbi:sulfurtransferase [Paramagnetospirillum kuznetsovii]|uniref:Sulfurtransferase n=1 Tax=Paramagnetospirillum kuznetsovii TaxID=2053833 RepID=A0A364NT88_9PROT|nr:rhodanese-like domain-containing protein [Paramagnetospirillum kuznetsovii]RAU20230.1 sulfurtransferase [Paramagnetospirillum kuznetsovii]
MPDTGIIEVTPQDAKAWLDKGLAILIDVREPYEYGFERIPGALLFPLATFEPKSLPLGETKKVVLQCGTAKRSGMAAQRAIDAGVATIYHVKGGLSAWKEAKLPILDINPATGAIEPKEL